MTQKMFTVPSGEEVEIDEDNRIETEIIVDLCEAVDRDLEGFLDYLSERVTDTPLLMDFSYTVTGVTPEGALIIKVNGDISEILQWKEDMGEDYNG